MLKIKHIKKASGYYTHTWGPGEAITSETQKEIEALIMARNYNGRPLIAGGLHSLIPMPFDMCRKFKMDLEYNIDVTVHVEGMKMFLIQWTRPIGTWSSPEEYLTLPKEVIEESFYPIISIVPDDEIVKALYNVGKIINDPEKGIVCSIYKFKEDGEKEFLVEHSLTASKEEKKILAGQVALLQKSWQHER